MTQCNMKKGLKKFGQDGSAALMKKVLQLHYGKVMDPKHGKELTQEEKRASLHSLIFLKREICGMAKGRGCAGRRKQ